MRALLVLALFTLTALVPDLKKPINDDRIVRADLIVVADFVGYERRLDELGGLPVAEFKVVRILKGRVEAPAVKVVYDLFPNRRILVSDDKLKEMMPKAGQRMILFLDRKDKIFLPTRGLEGGVMPHSAELEKHFKPLIAKRAAIEAVAVAAQMVADEFVSAKGWKVVGVRTKGNDGCRAQDVKAMTENDRPALLFAPVGKSSHACDSRLFIERTLTVPASTRLNFYLAKSHNDNAKTKVRLKVLSEDRKTVYRDEDITPMSNDWGVSCLNSFLFKTDKPSKVIVVIESTCRTRLKFSSATGTHWDPKAKAAGPLTPVEVDLNPKKPPSK